MNLADYPVLIQAKSLNFEYAMFSIIDETLDNVYNRKQKTIGGELT